MSKEKRRKEQIDNEMNKEEQRKEQIDNEQRKEKKKHTVGLEPTISCSVGKRLIQLGYACLSVPLILTI